MSKEQIESTDWLTRDIPKEQLEREKQEAVMSADLEFCHTEFATGVGEIYTDYDTTAQKMFAKGYRKQSEWISVEERLPEIETTGKTWGDHKVDKSVRVLCVCKQKSGKVLVKEGYYELFDFNQNPTWRIPGSIDSVTHWMPLPEPPMMKGGE